eukprot:scaffold306275_cov23-Prasinocladus_malaysianus.AAC.1
MHHLIPTKSGRDQPSNLARGEVYGRLGKHGSRQALEARLEQLVERRRAVGRERDQPGAHTLRPQTTPCQCLIVMKQRESD